MAHVPQKIVLKSTTKISLNDRWDEVEGLTHMKKNVAWQSRPAGVLNLRLISAWLVSGSMVHLVWILHSFGRGSSVSWKCFVNDSKTNHSLVENSLQYCTFTFLICCSLESVTKCHKLITIYYKTSIVSVLLFMNHSHSI